MDDPETPVTPKPTKRSRKWRWLGILAIVLGCLAIIVALGKYEYALLPAAGSTLVTHTYPAPAYDLWGEGISDEEAHELLASDEGKSKLSPEQGAVRVDADLLKLGREAFYRETFGNEIFLTDVLGLSEGPLSRWQYIKALADLNGAGTTNLRVALAEAVTLGERTWQQGEYIDTGLDVPRGSYTPLGLVLFYDRGQMREGFTCALCHAAVDPATGLVVEGAPNSDLNAGLLMAFATNSAAYFTHTDVNLRQLPAGSQRVELKDGSDFALPDPAALEQAVDEVFSRWPPGNFDSTIDLVANPAQIPDSFTHADHPYGWSGFGMAGPFHGLTALSNNVHAQNSDSLTQIPLSRALFDLDEEVYIGAILQNAARSKYRFDAQADSKPSEFFARIDPTPGTPGINELVLPPDFPQVSLAVPDGVVVNSPGQPFSRQNNALAAWQNTLAPPRLETEATSEATLGREVFERAGCAKCHAGEALTNNRIVAAAELGTEPTRAKSFAKAQAVFDPTPTLYAYDTPVPIPTDAKTMSVAVEHLHARDIELAWAQNDSGGGYKTPSLIGLRWTAPYLHDGGVAVGSDPKNELGLPGTLLRFRPADPANSLRALVDRELRQQMLAANRADPSLLRVNVTGEGHDFWIDAEAGFSAAEQQAAIRYLLESADVSPAPGSQPATTARALDVSGRQE